MRADEHRFALRGDMDADMPHPTDPLFDDALTLSL